MSQDPLMILAADIGGTHSRFALFRIDAAKGSLESRLHMVRKVRFSTASMTGTREMVEHLAQITGDDGGYFTPSSPDPVDLDAAVFGIPGPASPANPSLPPASGEVIHCPNMAWPVESDPASKVLGGKPVRLINDFVANGFACAMLPQVAETTTLRPGTPKPSYPRAVIGAGTGLGHCLVLTGPPVMVVGSEAGHAVFPFTCEEHEIACHFADRYGTQVVDGDMAIAGRGLSILYEYVTGEVVHPHQVPPLAAKNPEVMALAARFYGRVICHGIMNCLALGGVFITGGVAASIPEILTHPAFMEEVNGGRALEHLLPDVPLWHVRNQDTGLWGAAVCAALSLRGFT